MNRALKAAVTLVSCVLGAALLAPVAPSGASPAAALAAADACGTLVARAGGGYWTCTLAENFSGTRLNRDLWTAVPQAGDSDLCMVDNPRTVAVGMGKLRLSAVRADARTPCPVRADGTRASYASGWVTSFHRWGQQYGRIEARIKVKWANRSGLHEAFWLWPDVRHTADTPWPASGEIDVMETFSSYPNLAIPYLHYGTNDNGGPVPGLNTAWNCSAPRGQWHTYTLEWTAYRLAILVNGRTCLVNTHGAASFRKPFILNFTQFLGDAQNAYSGGISLPATMEVDYVRAWK